jgi:hypothetical protein
MATLLLELSWTRVLSVSRWYHFGFLVISTALLGFGIAGVVLALWERLTQAIPFDPFSLLADRRKLLLMPRYHLLVATPFFFSGLTIALLFTRIAKKVNVLYAYDLLGAGLGCATVALGFRAVFAVALTLGIPGHRFMTETSACPAPTKNPDSTRRPQSCSAISPAK